MSNTLRRITGATALLILMSAVSQANAGGENKGTPFTFKAFHPSTGAYYQGVTTSTKQKMVVNQTEISHGIRKTFYFRYTPKRIDKNGNFVVRQQIVGVDLECDIGGNRIAFCSFNGKAPKAAVKFLVGLLKYDVEFTLDRKTRKVAEFSGLDKFVKKMIKANPKQKHIIELAIDRSSIKEMIEVALQPIPPDGVHQTGSKWKNEHKLDLGPIGWYAFKTQYKIESMTEGKVVLQYDNSLVYHKAKDGKNLPFVIKHANLRSTAGKGKAVIDFNKGWVEQLETFADLVGDLTIEIGGIETKVSMEQGQTTKVVTSVKNPLAK